VRRETAATVTNLLADEQDIIRYADIRSYTNQASTRLEVVASDDDPRITTALGEEDYRRAIALLERHYNLILLDTGTGVLAHLPGGHPTIPARRPTPAAPLAHRPRRSRRLEGRSAAR
jgi:MinD-like ATPase involved in chromosome partitioning or flagellar assembly